MCSVHPVVLPQAMVKKREMLRKRLNGKTRKAMEFSLFQKLLKESSTEDPSSISPVQVADQLQKSLTASKKLHVAMETLVEKSKQVGYTACCHLCSSVFLHICPSKVDRVVSVIFQQYKGYG